MRSFVNYAIFCELCNRTRFEVDCAKSYHRVISEALLCIPHTGCWKQYDLYFRKKKKNTVKSTMSTVSYRIHVILKDQIFDLAHHKTLTVRWSEHPTDILEGYGFDFCWVLRKFFFQLFQLQNASLLFTLYLSHQSIYRYHLNGPFNF